MPMEHGPLADGCPRADPSCCHLPGPALVASWGRAASPPGQARWVESLLKPPAATPQEPHSPGCEPCGTSLSPPRRGSSVGHPGLGQGGPHAASRGLVTAPLPSSHANTPFLRMTHTTAPQLPPHRPTPNAMAKPRQAMQRGAALSIAHSLSSSPQARPFLPSNAKTQWQKSA